MQNLMGQISPTFQTVKLKWDNLTSPTDESQPEPDSRGTKKTLPSLDEDCKLSLDAKHRHRRRFPSLSRLNPIILLSLLLSLDPTHPPSPVAASTNDSVLEEMKKVYMLQQDGKGPAAAFHNTHLR